MSSAVNSQESSLKVAIVLTLKWWEWIFKRVNLCFPSLKKLDSPDEPESIFILLLLPAAVEFSLNLSFIIHHWPSHCLAPRLAVRWKNSSHFHSRTHRHNFLSIPVGEATLTAASPTDSTNGSNKGSNIFTLNNFLKYLNVHGNVAVLTYGQCTATLSRSPEAFCNDFLLIKLPTLHTNGWRCHPASYSALLLQVKKSQ